LSQAKAADPRKMYSPLGMPQKTDRKGEERTLLRRSEKLLSELSLSLSLSLSLMLTTREKNGKKQNLKKTYVSIFIRKLFYLNFLW
jgi:hypothetical protein